MCRLVDEKEAEAVVKNIFSKKKIVRELYRESRGVAAMQAWFLGGIRCWCTVEV